MLRPTFNLFFVTFCQEKKENIADFKKKAMGFLADICTFVCNLAVDALNNPRTLNYYEKNGFVLLLFCSGYFNFLLISFDCCIIICPMLSRIAASCSIW